MIQKLFLGMLLGGLMVATIGAYAATLNGTITAEGLGSSGNIQVNAPDVGDIDISWNIQRGNSDQHFGRVHGLTLTVQNAPGAGSSYDVLVRVEGANHVLLIGAIGHITGNSTSANMSFGIFLDPKDIENVIVVIDEG